MGKARNRSNKQDNSSSSTINQQNQQQQNENQNSNILNNSNTNDIISSSSSSSNINGSDNTTINRAISLASSLYATLCNWVYAERYGLAWVTSCVLLGFLLGLSIGTGYLTGAYGVESTWRQTLATRIRSCYWYELGNSIVRICRSPWSIIVSLVEMFGKGSGSRDATSRFGSILGSGGNGNDRLSPEESKFYALREMVIREEGGYVHPDLGFLIPAPSGASRGIGMVGTSYANCLQSCFNETSGDDNVLLRIPVSIQMTRSLALSTISPLLPHEVQRRAPLEDLDDAALLVLLLAHERRKDIESRFFPYIATLPDQPTCGYIGYHRMKALKSIVFLGQELGMDVNGWHAELLKASEYADRITHALSRDYGVYIMNSITSNSNHASSAKNKVKLKSMATSSFAAIQWALCQVSSRATAANPKLGGALRLVPLMDLVNHDVEASGFQELTPPDSSSSSSHTTHTDTDTDIGADHAGSFVLRTSRHGRPNILRQGKELMANYNVPNYSPLDWFINIGFVPTERTHRWVKLDAALPRQYARITPTTTTNTENDNNNNNAKTNSNSGHPFANNGIPEASFIHDLPMGNHHHHRRGGPGTATRLNVVTSSSDGASTTHHFHIQNEL